VGIVRSTTALPFNPKSRQRSKRKDRDAPHPAFSHSHAKINFKTVSHFSSLKSDRQRTTFTTHSTTFSPQKNHPQTRTFFQNTPQNISKNSKTPVRTRVHFFFKIHQNPATAICPS
jgi:hypothetical protein